MHPLTGDLTTLTTEELHSKYGDLVKRINQASRMGQSDAVYQLQMFMADYQNEINNRNAKLMEEMASKSAEFKNIIDIS